MSQLRYYLDHLPAQDAANDQAYVGATNPMFRAPYNPGRIAGSADSINPMFRAPYRPGRIAGSGVGAANPGMARECTLAWRQLEIAAGDLQEADRLLGDGTMAPAVRAHARKLISAASAIARAVPHMERCGMGNETLALRGEASRLLDFASMARRADQNDTRTYWPATREDQRAGRRTLGWIRGVGANLRAMTALAAAPSSGEASGYGLGWAGPVWGMGRRC